MYGDSMSYLVMPYTPKRERKICIVDLEGYRDFRNNCMVPYLAGVYNPHVKNEKDTYDVKEPFEYFKDKDCVKEFVDKYMTHSYRGYVFYAHFGSIFDFPIILNELNKRDFNIYPIMKGSKIIKMIISDKFNHRWYFCDSSALLGFSLDDLTKTFNVEYKKLHVVEKNESYDRNLYKLYLKDPDTVIEYLEHDCIGLYEVLDKFKKEILNIGGDLGLTIASTSLKTFTRSYQKKPFFMCSKTMNDELRNAYFGGRTEIFRMIAPVKDDYYYYYDINSLYPFVMKKYPYPISRPIVINNPDTLIYMENDGITNAKVNAPTDLYIPVLPAKIKLKSDNKLMFVVGEFSGWWDNHLLRKAREIGYTIDPIKSYIFESDYIFKEFVDDFYKIKQNAESGTPMYLIAKLLMNSLYGKYGQRQISESMIKDPDPDKEKYTIKDFDIETGWARVEEEGKGKAYLPQIAIHVTAMAQLWLYESLEKIVDKGYKLFYCDTDSITTDYGGFDDSKMLGEWKLEKRISSGYFVLPKTYKLIDDKGKTELRAKGYNRRLQEKITEDAYKRALMNDDYSGFSVISDNKEMLRASASFHRFKDFNKLDYIRRSIQTRYNKRKILKDFDTRPFDMKELK
jgi:hypothetical protein